jgi:hypothetical protein
LLVGFHLVLQVYFIVERSCRFVFRNTVDVALKYEIMQRFKPAAQHIVTLKRRALYT